MTKFIEFDPALHPESTPLYELQNLPDGAPEGITGTVIVPSTVPYFEAVKTPWYYLVEVPATAAQPATTPILSRVGAEVRDWLAAHSFSKGRATMTTVPTAIKAATYQVQPFHRNFGLADENAKWSFSAADGRALLDKGGWTLYKQCHLVYDISDGATPERQTAYTYPVAKLVDGKPTYFLRAAQTVYAGLMGGARGAKLPAAVNAKVLETVKRIYKAYGRETEQMGTKAEGRFITKDGIVRFIGGAGSGGGTAGGGDTSSQGSTPLDANAKATLNDAYIHITSIRNGVANTTGDYQRLQQARRDLTDVSRDLAQLNIPLARTFEAGIDEVRQLIFDTQPYHDIASVSKKTVAMLDALRQALSQSTKSYLPQEGAQSCAFAFKALDGSDWWMQWTTNGFQDREGEIFQTKALEDFVERHRSDPVKGEFWYRHIPGTKFGTVRWQAMVGRFLVQAGPFDDTPVGHAFKKFFQQFPDGHPVIAPEGWGTSHGYQYKAADRSDGVYGWLEIQESTVLPLRVASNPWSPHPRIVKRGVKMNETERKELERIGGAQLVEMVIRESEQRTKDLERVGVGFKGLEDGKAMLMALMEGVEDENIREALAEIYAVLEAPDEGKAEEEAMGEMAEEAEEAAAEEMPPAPSEAEPVPPPMKGKALTREEVADAMAVVVQQLRTELAASNKALQEALTATLKPLVETVAQLQERDGAKIAAKAAATPAASLQELVSSVLQQPAAGVKADDPLLTQRPQEAPAPAQPQDGLPSFLASLLNPKQ